MGKRSAVVELFLGDMGSMQRELRPSIQREDQPTMETKLGQIAVKAVNQLPKSVVREIRTPRSVGAGGGQLPPATRWARGNSRPYRESHRCLVKPTRMTQVGSGVSLAFVTQPVVRRRRQDLQRAPLSGGTLVASRREIRAQHELALETAGFEASVRFSNFI